MPNHCESDLFLRGPKADLEEIQTIMQASQPADVLVPYPQEFKDLDRKRAELMEKAKRGEIPQQEAWSFKDGFNSGGYEWCIKNWGTKWGLYDIKQKSKLNKGKLSYSFQSAWAPPMPVIEAMAKQYPNVEITLKFYEMGAAYQGVHVWKGGKKVSQLDSEYHGQRGG